MAFNGEKAALAVRALLEGLGFDPESAELKETPARVADYWAERLAGYEVRVPASARMVCSRTGPGRLRLTLTSAPWTVTTQATPRSAASSRAAAPSG